jgi:hypothetical protein
MIEIDFVRSSNKALADDRQEQNCTCEYFMIAVCSKRSEGQYFFTGIGFASNITCGSHCAQLCANQIEQTVAWNRSVSKVLFTGSSANNRYADNPGQTQLVAYADEAFKQKTENLFRLRHLAEMTGHQISAPKSQSSKCKSL